MAEVLKIVTTFGGPCIYKRGLLQDGSTTGRIRYTGQSDAVLREQLIKSIETGRDDVATFVDKVIDAQ